MLTEAQRRPSLHLPVHRRETFHYIHRLDRHIDDAQQQVQDIAGLVVLDGPVVGIVGDEIASLPVSTPRESPYPQQIQRLYTLY